MHFITNDQVEYWLISCQLINYQFDYWLITNLITDSVTRYWLMNYIIYYKILIRVLTSESNNNQSITDNLTSDLITD